MPNLIITSEVMIRGGLDILDWTHFTCPCEKGVSWGHGSDENTCIHQFNRPCWMLDKIFDAYNFMDRNH